MLIRNGIYRRVQAIREGLDDRLLVLIEFDVSAAMAALACGERMCAWRAAYEDELEVVAFLRMHSTATDSPFNIDGKLSAAQSFHTLGLPVAIGVTAVPLLTSTCSRLEQWAWCDSDRQIPFDAPRTQMPADLLFMRCADAMETPRLVIGCKADSNAADQAALAAQTAEDISCGMAETCGLLLAPFGDERATPSNDTQPFLKLLADAVYGRRTTVATRRFAPLRCGL